MKELKIKFNRLRIDVIAILVIQFIMCLLIMYDNTTTNKRLDAHKEVIELQQEQINKLILNAKKHELNK